MAIYTELSDGELRAILAEYAVPKLVRSVPIPEGSINTNYSLQLESGKAFLRHSTVRSEADLDFEATVLDALTRANVRAPHLHRTKAGAASLPFKGGRVSLFGFLPGEELTRARFTTEHAGALGRALASMHLALQPLPHSRPNPYGPEVVRGWIKKLDDPANGLGQIPFELERALDLSLAEDRDDLPRGVIHADLFIDNVKWTANDAPCFFDFEMACRDALALDVAITLNAWAFDGEQYMAEQCRAFTAGYQQIRPLSPIELYAFWNKALFGAVRYTASRIRDFHLSKLPPDKLFKKDFRTYLNRTHVLQRLGRKAFNQLVGL
ncbi:MAG: homoserine kinase [Myxococcaceae bacterium]